MQLLYKGMPQEAKYRNEIKKLQTLLRKRGIPVTVDGFFGPGTSTGVKEFQDSTPGLSADGIVGKGTWAALLNQDDYLEKSSEKLLIDITDYFLEDDEYYREIVKKDTVYLHPPY